MTYTNQIGIGFDNSNGKEVIHANITIYYKGIFGMKLRLHRFTSSSIGFTMGLGGGPSFTFKRFEFKRPNIGKQFPGLAKVIISGEINGKQFSKIGIFMIFHEKTSLINM